MVASRSRRKLIKVTSTLGGKVISLPSGPVPAIRGWSRFLPYHQRRLIGSLGLVALVVVMSTGRWCRGIRHHPVLLRTIRTPIVITRRDGDPPRASPERRARHAALTRNPSRTGSHPRGFTHTVLTDAYRVHRYSRRRKVHLARIPAT